LPDEAAAGPAKPSVEAEFAALVQNMDLYVRQKIDLYIQHYLLDPLEFVLEQIIYLAMVASLLVVGTVAVTVGVILFIASLIPIWAALLICGVAAMLLAGVLAYFMFARKLIMKTPKAVEPEAAEAP
jgi:hypothetical protein